MNFLYDNFISDFLVIVIEWIFQFVGEYSITIILAMLFVRFVLMPLDLKSKRSMKQMAALGPEVESLKKRYANNPEQLNKKVQQLYKERGVSTMAGCLPMLVTLLLLSAFYGALRTIATEQTMALVLGAAENGAENTQLTSWLWGAQSLAARFWQRRYHAHGHGIFILPAAEQLGYYAPGDGAAQKQRVDCLFFGCAFGK